MQQTEGHHKVSIEEVINTLEWLLTALILALVFRAFVVEAFRIPTGSMADTLMGAHFRLRCPQCGYEYNHGFIPERYGLVKDSVPHDAMRLPQTRCPSCGYERWTGSESFVSDGDRILVFKSIYQFFEPKRWDVVVFKNPLDPRINYVKRMIARPGETVEIIDGDIYIKGLIARKSSKVQEELWMPVYENDYQPARGAEVSFNSHAWEQPFNVKGSGWRNDDLQPAFFHLDSPGEQINRMYYDTTVGNDFKTAYAYDDVRDYENMPYCSDLMLRFYVTGAGRIGAGLSKYETNYRAWLDSTGKMSLTKIYAGGETELASKESGLKIDRPTLVRFSNVDHQLVFEVGSEKLTVDLGELPTSAGPRKTDIEPRVEVLGAGRLTLSHVSIFRDIHYTSARGYNSARGGRASEGNSLTLKKDQFFVLGDNSPNSEDSRYWSHKGIGNNGVEYDEGIVPRDYLVGKAIFVYWPAGFRLRFGTFDSWFAFIPNVGKLRFIYGG